jgi:putative metalloprotease
MIKIVPILLAAVYALITARLSVWQTKRELDSKSTQLADPRLNPLMDQIAAALGVMRVPVFIYEIDPINGLASPDGRIFITRGMYQKMLSNDITKQELASVIAHELGHVALGHAKRRMSDFAGQNALRATLMMVIGRYVPLIGPLIANGLAGLLASGLSRSDEYEADAYAAALLVKAGIGIAPQISMFEKLETITGARAGVAPAWTLSHPKTKDRIAALKKLSADWE